MHHQPILLLSTLSSIALASPVPSLDARQFRPQLTFQGARMQDGYTISAPGDGTPVTISSSCFF